MTSARYSWRKMGKVNLACVDERLIHGQVMLTLSQRDGVNSIFVVGDVVAKILLWNSAGTRTVRRQLLWQRQSKILLGRIKFKDYSYLIAKTVKTIYDLVKYDLKHLVNIGGVAKKMMEIFLVTKSVHLTLVMLHC